MTTCLLAAIAVATSAVVAPSAQADTTMIVEPAQCCAPAVRVDPPDPLRKAQSVGLIGDSLSVGITDDRFQIGPPIQDVIRSTGRTMWIDTTIAMTMPIGLDVLVPRGRQVSGTDVVVVALGTNDVTGGTDRVGWSRAIEQIVRQVAGSNPDAVVIWVDLDVPRLASRAAAFNEVLRESAEREPSLVVCDWASTVSVNPQWLGGDRLHLNGSGYAARRDLIVACIDDVRVA